MLVSLAAATAAEMAVNGGAITMSQDFVSTRGAKAEKKARVSASVLYIFQLPAITRRLMGHSWREKRTEKYTAETQRGWKPRTEAWSFVGEGLDAWELASGEEF